MPNCTHAELTFPSFDRRKIEANFSGGDVSSDGGILLLREADRRLGLVEALDAVLPDPRDPALITHRQADLLRQRIYGLALGYEDLNDHATLRQDLAWQTALERDTELASSPTLCRLEQRVDRKAAVAFHQVLIEKFIASFAEAPTELILDFDATDDRVHGTQEGRFYHGYYGNWCFLPLDVFCGEQLLVSYLRPSNRDGARHAWAILKLLTQRLREAWPQVRLIMRADSGFCRYEDAALVRLGRCGLHHRPGAQPAPGGARRTAHGPGRSGLCRRAAEAADLRLDGLCGRHMGSAAAGHREGRVQRAGEEPALCGDQPGGRPPGAL